MSGIYANLHHVCDTAPHCACADGPSEEDECCCCVADSFLLSTTCCHCGQPMYAIDLESGERLGERAERAACGGMLQ